MARIRPRVTVAITVALAVIFAAPAHAEPAGLAPQAYSKTTSDGWQLTVNLDNETVNSVPNLAAAVNSREGFVTVRGAATASGGAAPILDSLFILGYQLGCQSDVSSGLQLGANAGISPGISVGTSGVNAGVSAGIGGFVQTILQPGVIVDLPLSNMALDKGGRAVLDVDNIHIKADACGGDVTIRSYGYLRVSTESSHTSFAIYGDPVKI
jgi:MspA